MASRTLMRTATAGAVAVLAVTSSTPPAFADGVRDAQWHLRYLKIAEAHQITKGAGVTVAVIDTGVDAGHSDLEGSVLPGTNVTILKEGSAEGWTDEDGHGTAMAGLISAHGRGADGVLGVAPESKILPIRLKVRESDQVSGFPEAVQFAINHGAKVINMSIGRAEPDDDEKAALQAAAAADIVLVASAGNRSEDSAVPYPAAYPGVLAIGAVNHDGNLADLSVTGPQVALAAPGVDIVTTGIKSKDANGYHTGSGTSDSTAIVAGAAALVRARYPELSAEEVVHRLTATATDKGAPGRDPEYGYGIVNIVDALTAHVDPVAKPPGGAAGPGSDAPSTLPRKQWPLGALAAIGGGVLLLLLGAVGAVFWLIRNRRTA